MAELEIPFTSFEVDIAGTIEAQQGKDPCYTCAFFRRGGGEPLCPGAGLQ